MSLFVIDKERCNQDGICVAECPAGILELKEGDSIPIPIENAEAYCIKCGHCVAVCPSGAFSLKDMKLEQCTPIRKELAITAGQAEQFLCSRRSIRNFKNRPIERENLEKLLEIACYAPSAKNKQPWHWLVIEGDSEVQRLAGMVIDRMRAVIRKNLELAEKLEFTRFVEAWDRGHGRICRNAPCVIIVHGNKNWGFGIEDCTLALNQFTLFAPAFKLGTCWAGVLYTIINQHAPLFEMLQLSRHHQAYGAMMVGDLVLMHPLS